jgi:hypothetical protein
VIVQVYIDKCSTSVVEQPLCIAKVNMDAANSNIDLCDNAKTPIAISHVASEDLTNNCSAAQCLPKHKELCLHHTLLQTVVVLSHALLYRKDLAYWTTELL